MAKLIPHVELQGTLHSINYQIGSRDCEGCQHSSEDEYENGGMKFFRHVCDLFLEKANFFFEVNPKGCCNYWKKRKTIDE